MVADSPHSMDDRLARPLSAGQRRIAWDGVSFGVPSNRDPAMRPGTDPEIFPA